VHVRVHAYVFPRVGVQYFDMSILRRLEKTECIL